MQANRSLGYQRSAIDAERKPIQHGCAIGQKKANNRSDVFAFGKPAQRNPRQLWAAFGRITPGAFPHLR